MLEVNGKNYYAAIDYAYLFYTTGEIDRLS
jgi:hypothetical protein